MAKSYEALMKAESERARAAQQPDRTSAPRRNGRRRSSPVDLSHLDPNVEEQYQKLRGLLFANGARDDLRSVMVVGSKHGDGTTTTCTILASLLARSNGGAVVLIDANLRTPALHELFSLPPTARGLTDVASQNLRGRDLVQDTPIPNLSVIQVGRPLASPAALYQEPMAALIAELRQEFRYVMLDCSPVEHYSDASFVAPKVDGIVMVIRSQVTRIETAIKAKRQLEWAGGKVIGTVLNDTRNYIPLLLQRFL
jgi:capsular exopolysaccharide synthesis family protein